jgi:hypothetical protein
LTTEAPGGNGAIIGSIVIIVYRFVLPHSIQVDARGLEKEEARRRDYWGTRTPARAEHTYLLCPALHDIMRQRALEDGRGATYDEGAGTGRR